MNLYDLTNEYESLQYEILSDDEDTAFAAWGKLAITEAQINDKADAYARIIKNLSAEANAYKTEEQRLHDLRKSRENAVERLKNLIHEAMVVTNQQKIDTTIGKFSLQKNPPSCKVVDAKLIPDEYWIPVEPKLDGKSVIEHFKQTGEQLPGTEVVQEMGLRFR